MGSLNQSFESVSYILRQKLQSSSAPYLRPVFDRKFSDSAHRYELQAVLLGFFFFAFMIDSFGNKGDSIISKENERKLSVVCLLAATICYGLSKRALKT